MIVHGRTEYVEAELSDGIIYVTYGELIDEHVVGTTERIGHFLEPGEEYPRTEARLREVLESIVS